MASKAQSPVPGLGVPGFNLIPCLLPLAIAVLIILELSFFSSNAVLPSIEVVVRVERIFAGILTSSKGVKIIHNEDNQETLIPSVIDHGGFGGIFVDVFLFFLLLLGIS